MKKATLIQTVTATAGSLGVLVVVQASVAQRHPDLSGDWVLVRATMGAMSARSTTETPPNLPPDEEATTTARVISGAAFNCGRECRIVQTGEALTVDGARFESGPATAPPVTLRLDGRAAHVIDSVNPAREVAVAAVWKGDTLEIVTTGRRILTQVVTLESGQLVVVTRTNRGSAAPVTFTYARKQG